MIEEPNKRGRVKYRREGPRKKWPNTITDDLRFLGWDKARRLAMDRDDEMDKPALCDMQERLSTIG